MLQGKGKGKATVAVKAAPAAAAAASSTAEVDKSCPKAGNPGVSVCSGHDVKLNQTNIANNNNKFYILQVLPRALQCRVECYGAFMDQTQRLSPTTT